MSKVGIILVNYNGFNDTIKCIESLSQITYPEYAIIVVDNNSSDDSYEQLSKLDIQNYFLIKSDENVGFSGGNNIGINYAKILQCEYVLLLNNDTLVDKDFLSALVSCAEKNDNCVAVTGKIYYACDKKRIWYAGGSFNQITGRSVHYGIHSIDNGQFDSEKEVSFITGCCMLMPMELIDQVGLMEEKYFLYCEDIDYCCRIRAKELKMVYDPKAIIYHKVSASTGKLHNLSTYYTVRNKRIIIDNYLSGINKIIARMYNYLEESKRILLREYAINTVKQARNDAKNGALGKANNINI